MTKTIYHSIEAQEHVYNGAKKLYDAVRVTLGPKGRNFIISQKYVEPYLTHDGVTVAENVELEGAEEVGASFIRSAAKKNANLVGDGTTTTTILTYSLINGFRDVLVNPMRLATELNEEAEYLCSQLAPHDRTDITAVATISASDASMGAVVAEAVSTVGHDGSIVVQPSQSLDTTVEFVEGFSVGSGYMSPYMITDSETGKAVHEDVPLLVLDGKLESVNHIGELLQQMSNQKKLVIVANDVTREVLARLVMLHNSGTFSFTVIKSPELGQRRTDVLEDLCAVTGATLIKTDSEITNKVLGRASKIVVDAEKTIVTGVTNHARYEHVSASLKATVTERDEEFVKNRLANLNGKVAIIHVGGTTDHEVRERIFRIDDAVAACRAAMKEGVVPGGATTYLNLDTHDTDAGVLFKNALEQPFRQLMQNAGLDADEKIELVRQTGLGINVMTPDKPVDLMEVGIVDPIAVVKAAITTAASVAASVITMGGLIVENKEKDDSNA